jgi:hypothetical protein
VRRVVSAAVRAAFAAAAGIALAAAVGAAADDQRTRDLLAYAVATGPLAAVLGAIPLRPVAGSAGRRWIGAAMALGAAAITATVLAAIRFRYQGSVGTMSLGVLPFAREILFLPGLAPALALVGARTGRMRWSAAAGLGAALLAGPMLLVSAALGAVPLLNPFTVTALVVLGVAGLSLRVSGSGPAPSA